MNVSLMNIIQPNWRQSWPLYYQAVVYNIIKYAYPVAGSAFLGE